MAARELEAKIVLSGQDKTAAMWMSATSNLRRFTDSAMRVSGSSGLPRVAGALADVGRAAGNMAHAMRPALHAISTLAGIGAAGGIAALSMGMQQSAQRIDEVAKKAKQLGMDFQSLREFAYVAAQQDVGWSSLSDGLTKAATGYASVKTHSRGLYSQLSKSYPTLAKQIEGAKDAGEAYDRMFGAIHKALAKGDKAGAMKLSEMFFGTTDFTKIGELSGQQMVAGMKDGRKVIGVLTEEQAQKIDVLGDSYDRLRATVGGVFDAATVEALPKLTPLIDAMSAMLAGNRGEIAKAIGDGVATIGAWATSVDWASFGNNIAKLATSFDAMVAPTIGWSNAIAGLAVAPLVLPVAGLALAISRLGWALATTPAGITLAALALAAYEAFKHWGEIEAFFTGLGNSSSVTDFYIKLSTGVHSAVTTIKTDLADLERSIFPEWLSNFDPGKLGADLGRRAHDYVFGDPASRPGAGAPGKGNLPRIPGRAAGGPVSAGSWNIVGERGPELVRWGASGTVINANLTRALASPASAGAAGQAFAAAIALPFKELSRSITDLADAITGGWGAGDGLGGGGAGLPASGRGSGGRNIYSRLAAGAAGVYSGGAKSENVADWMNFLMDDMGADKASAAAVVAGLMGESGQGLDPGAIGDQGTAFGTAQWREGRFAGLLKTAASMGAHWTDREAQQAWFKKEMEGAYRKVWDAILGTDDPVQKLDIYDRRYEVTANPTRDLGIRSGYLGGLLKTDFTPAMKDADVSAAALKPQRVDIGKGELKVSLRAQGGIGVSGIASVSPGNLDVAAGVDNSGKRLWQPHPGQQ
jgi:hypothetical protein